MSFFAGGKRSQFLIKTSCPNLHPPESHHASTSALLSGPGLSARRGGSLSPLHRGSFPSTCACGVSARSLTRSLLSPFASPASHTLQSSKDSHLFFIVTSSDVECGGRGCKVKKPSSDNEILSMSEKNLGPLLIKLLERSCFSIETWPVPFPIAHSAIAQGGLKRTTQIFLFFSAHKCH